MKRHALPLIVAFASATTPAIAQPKFAGHAAIAKHVTTAATAKEPENDLLPNVTLRIEAPTTRGTWSMRLANEGDVPVRIVADARLLALEVVPRGARNALHCELPADMKPENDLERPLVLPPHRAYSESFEPRLYCPDAKRLDALAPGSIVVAHLGWRGHAARYLEVSPIEGIEPKIAGRASIDAPPIVLPDEPTPTPSQTTPDVLADLPRLSLRSAVSVDAESASKIEIPVTLRNEGTRAVVVRFRPETLRFELLGPESVDHCAWPSSAGAPILDQFVTIRPKGTTSLSVVLVAYCGAHALDQSGLYLVVARLDTREASGATLGLHTFDGEVTATSPTVVRLHRGRAPKVLPRPKLEP
ncbi:MAG: hypothetical protein ACLP1X_19550 [Polyangiaceae bacterium]